MRHVTLCYLVFSPTETLVPLVLPAPSGQCIDHPLALNESALPTPVCFGEDDTFTDLLVIPYSFTQLYDDIPVDTVTVHFSLSNRATNSVGTPLFIGMRTGFALGANSTLSPSTNPSTYSESAYNATSWKSVSFTPARVLIEYEYSTVQTLWGPTAWPVTASMRYTLAPGVVIYNATLTVAVSNQAAISTQSESFSTSAEWSTTLPPIDSTAHADSTFVFTTLQSNLTTALLSYTFNIPEFGASGERVLPLSDPSASRNLNISSASLTFDYIDNDGVSKSETETVNVGLLAVHNMLATSSGTVLAQDKAPLGTTPNDHYAQTVTINVSPYTPASLSVTINLDSKLVVDFDGVANLTIPGYILGQSGTLVLPVNLSSFSIDTSTIAVDGQTKVTLPIATYLQSLPGYTQPYSGTHLPPAPLTLSFPLLASPFGAGEFLTSGDILRATVRVVDQGVPFDSASTQLTLAFGPMLGVISHLNGAPPTGVPIFIQDSLVTYHVRYTSLTSWKDLTLSLYLPYPVLNVASLIFDGSETANSTLNPPVNTVYFGSANTGPVPVLVPTNDKIIFQYGSHESVDSSSTVMDLYFTVKVGRTIMYNDKAPVTTAWTYTNNHIPNPGSIPGIVGTPRIAVSTAVFYLYDSTATYSTPCAYCFQIAPVNDDCTTFIFPRPSEQRTKAMEAGTNLVNDYLPPISKPVFLSIPQNLQAGDRVAMMTWIQNFGSASASNIGVSATLPAGLMEPTNPNVCAALLFGTQPPFTGTTLFNTTGIYFPRQGPVSPVISPSLPSTGRDMLTVAHDMVISDTVISGSRLTYYDKVSTFNDETLPAPYYGPATLIIARPKVESVTWTSPMHFETDGQGRVKAQVGQTFKAAIEVSIPGSVLPNFQVAMMVTGAADVAGVTVHSVTDMGTLTGSSLSLGSPATVSDFGNGTSNQAIFGFGASPKAGRAVPFSRVKMEVTFVVKDNAASVLGAEFAIASSVIANQLVGESISATKFIIAEPSVLFVSQTSSVSSGDANDEITVNGRLTIGSTGDVWDLAFSTSFSADTFDYTLNSFSVTPSVPFTVLSQAASGFTIRLNSRISQAVLGTTSFLYSYKVRVSANARTSTLLNTATPIVWLSAPAATNPGGRAGAISTASISFQTIDPTVSVSISSSDVPATTGSNLAIGEVATLLVTLRLPEGRTDVSSVVYTLPTGAGVNLQSMLDGKVTSIGSNIVGSPWAINFAPTYDAATNKISFPIASAPATIINQYDNTVNAADTIVFQLRIYNADVPLVKRPNTLASSVLVSFSGSAVATTTASLTTTVVEPQVAISTGIARVQCSRKGGVQSGCILTSFVYLTVTESSLSPGYNGLLRVDSSLLNEITVSTIAYTTVGGAAASLLPAPSVTTFSYSVPVISGANYNFTFETVLDDQVNPGMTLGFNATLNFVSVPNAVAPVQARPYSLASNVSFVSYTPQPLLKAVETGLNLDVSRNDAVVPPGEVLSYNLTILIARGRNTLSCRIYLPPHMIFEHTPAINRAEVHSVGPLLDISLGHNLGVGTVGNLSSSTPSGPLDVADFNFGVLSAVGEEEDISTAIVIYFAVRVDASLALNKDTLSPYADVFFVDQSQLIMNPLAAKFVSANVNVSEPLDVLTTSSIPAPGDAGDLATLSITLTPPTGALVNFYDVSAVISVDPTSHTLTGVFNVLASDASLTAYNLVSSTPQTVTLGLALMPFSAGTFITIQYEVKAAETVTPGQFLDSTVALTWFSTNYTHTNATLNRQYTKATQTLRWPMIQLPPTDSIAPYASNVDAPVAVPAFSRVPIGSTVTFEQRIQVIEGVTRTIVNVAVHSAANQRMEAVSARVVLAPQMSSNVDVSITNWPLSSSKGDSINDRITLDLGSITNPSDALKTNDFFYVYFDAIPLDQSLSVDGTTLAVSTTMNKGAYETTNTSSVTIVEPVLLTTTTSSTLTGDAGDRIPLKISVRHMPTSRAHAYAATVVIDNLPPQITLDSSGFTSTVTPSTSTLTATSLTLVFNKFSLGDAAINITVDAIVGQSAHPKQVLQISSYSSYRSTPLASKYRQVSSARVSTSFTMLTVPTVSQYDFAIIPVTPPTIPNRINIGEKLILNATLPLIEGTFNDIALTFNMLATLFEVEDAQVTYIGSSISATGLALAATPTSSSMSASPAFVTWLYNNVVNTVNNADDGFDVVTVTARVRLLDVPAATRGLDLPFNAVLRSETHTVSLPITYRIVEGAVSVSATATGGTGQGGSTTTTTVKLNPSAMSDGLIYNLEIKVTHPTGLDITQSSISITTGHTWTSMTFTNAQSFIVRFSTYNYATGAIELQFTSTVNPVVTPGQSLVTSYSATYSSAADTSSSRVTVSSSTTTYNVLPRPPTSSSFVYAGSQYAHPVTQSATYGEQYSFTGSFSLLSATYSSLSLEFLMPVLVTNTRMRIIDLRLTAVPTSVPAMSTALEPVYGTATGPVGSFNSSAKYTWGALSVQPTAGNGPYLISFSGILEVTYPDATPAPATSTLTITSNMVTPGLTETLILVANQVYSTPAATFTGWSGTNKEAGSLATLVYTLTKPATMGWQNIVMHMVLPAPFSLDGAPTTTPSAGATIDTSDPTHLTATFPSWAWNSTASTLVFTVKVRLTQNVHPTQSIATNVYTVAQTAPASPHSYTATFGTITQTATALRVPTGLVTTIAVTDTQYKAYQLSNPQVNVGELMTFTVRFPLFHGNYTTYTANIFMSSAITDDMKNAYLNIVSASVTAVGSGISTYDGALPLGTTATTTTQNAAGANVISVFVFNRIYNVPDGAYNTNDFITITVVARVRNITQSVAATVLRAGASYKAEALTTEATVTSSTHMIQDFTLNTLAATFTHSLSTIQAGDVFSSTVTFGRVADLGFGSNLTLTLLHPAGINFHATNLMLTSSLLPVSSFEVVDKNTLKVVFDLAPARATLPSSTVTVLTFQSIGDVSIIPGRSYVSTVDYEAFTVPKDSSPDVRRNSGRFSGTATMNSQVSPVLTSQPCFTITGTEYLSNHGGVVHISNVGEASYFVSCIAFIRGTTPTASLNVATDISSGLYLANLEDVSISLIGPSITATPSLVLGTPPTSSSSDSVGVYGATFSFTNIVNSATGPESGFEGIKVTGKIRSRNMTAVRSETVITGLTRALPHTVLNSAYSDATVIREAQFSISSFTSNATTGQAGDLFTHALTLTPTAQSNTFVTNMTLTITIPAQMAFGELSAISASQPISSATLTNAVTLVVTFNIIPSETSTQIFFPTSMLTTVHPTQVLPINANAVYYSSNLPGVNAQTRMSPRITASTSLTVFTQISASAPSKAMFEFGVPEYAHDATDVINVGETIPFKGQVAIIKATFTKITIRVDMPSTTTTQVTPSMSIESLSVEGFGSSISGSGLSIGALPTSQITDLQGRVYSATFEFTNVVNLPGADVGNETIRFSGVARVLDVPYTVNSAVLTARATFSPEGYTASITDAISVVEGYLALTVVSTPDSGQGGDNMTTTAIVSPTSLSTSSVYNATVTLTADAPLKLSDPLDLQSSSPYSSLTIIDANTVLLVYSEVLKSDQAIRITLRRSVEVAQTPGRTYQQHVYLTYNSSKTAIESRQRTTAGHTTFNIFDRPYGASRPRLRIIATEFPHQVPSTVNVGESFTFEAAVALLYSTFDYTNITVDMPLTSGGAARMSIEASWLSFIGPFITGNDLSLGVNATSITPSSSGPDVVQQVFFSFSNVVNAPNGDDEGQNLIIVRGIARVLNIAENFQTSPDLTIQGIMAPTGTSDTLTTSLRIIEPFLALTASSTPDYVEGGIKLKSRILIPHTVTSDAAAYNITLLVSYPPEIKVISDSSAIVSSLPGFSAFEIDDSTLMIFFPRLEYGTSPITLDLTAMVNETIRPHETYTTTYNMTWLSATNLVEHRTRGAVATTFTTSFTEPQSMSPPSFKFTQLEFHHPSSTAVDPKEINIGESVHFEAKIALLHATFDEIQLVISVPTDPNNAGTPLMAIESAEVSFIGPNIVGDDLALDGIPTDVDLLNGYVATATFVFTNVVNAPHESADIGDDFIVVTGIARVLNVEGVNIDGTTLTAHAEITYSGYNEPMDSSVKVVEGILQMGASSSQSLRQAGDHFHITTNVKHSAISDSQVYNLSVTLSHPPELSFVVPFVIESSVAYKVVAESTNQAIIEFDMFDFTAPEIVFSIESVINAIAHPAATYTTQIAAEYESSYSVVSESRTRVINGITTEISIYDKPMFVSQPAFSYGLPEYTHNEVDTINIGEAVPFTAQVALVVATHSQVEIVISMPTSSLVLPDTSLVAIESVKISHIGSSISGTGVVLDAGPSSTVISSGGYVTEATFSFTDVLNTPHGDDIGDDIIVFTGIARVLNVESNVRGSPLQASVVFRPEGSEALISDSLTVVEGELSVSTSSTPTVMDGDKLFETTLSFSPTPYSNGIVYNLTTTVSYPPALRVAYPLNVVASNAQVVHEVEAISESLLFFRILSYNYEDGPFTLTFLSDVTVDVHPDMTYTTEIEMTYSSSKNADADINRLRTLLQDTSITTLTNPDEDPTFVVARKSLPVRRDENDIQICEEIVFHHTVYLRAYTLATFNATVVVPQGGLMEITSATIIETHHVSSVAGLGEIEVGASAVLNDQDGDSIADAAVFEYQDVLSNASDAYIVFEIVAKTLNSSEISAGLSLTAEAFFQAENLESRYNSIEQTVVEPVVLTSFQPLGEDVFKLDLMQTTPMSLTIAHDAVQSSGNAYNLHAKMTLPESLRFVVEDFQFMAPFDSVVLTTADESSFSFTVPSFNLTSQPIILNYTVQLVDLHSQPGDLHLLTAFVDFASVPLVPGATCNGRFYSGKDSKDLDTMFLHAAAYYLETGFPFMDVTAWTDNLLPDNVVVVGDPIFVTAVVRLPSNTRNMVFTLTTPLASLSFSQALVHSSGSNIVMGSIPDADFVETPYGQPSGGLHSAVFSFPSVVTDMRTSAGGTREALTDDVIAAIPATSSNDLVTLSFRLLVTNDVLNQDGSLLTINGTLSFEGGPSQRLWFEQYTLRQPTLVAVCPIPTRPATITSPTYDLELSGDEVPSPSVVHFDAGDIIVGNVSIKHSPGSQVRAENTTIYVALQHDVNFETFVIHVRGQSYDLSDPTNWNMITQGAGVFPPPVPSSENGTEIAMQFFIGELAVGQDVFITYSFRVLQSAQPGDELPFRFVVGWSSLAVWEKGRVALSVVTWNLPTSTPFLPATSSYGALTSTLKSRGDQGERVELPGPQKTLASIGDIVIMRSVVYLPEGTYKDVKIHIEFDEHLVAQPLLAETGDWIAGGSELTAPLESSITPIDLRDFFSNANVTDNQISIALEDDLVVTNSTDGHLVPLVFYFSAGVLDLEAVTQGQILAQPKLNFSWAFGAFQLIGDKAIQIAMPRFRTTFASMTPVIAPSTVFNAKYTIAPSSLSDAPAFQLSVFFDLNAKGSLTLLKTISFSVESSTPSSSPSSSPSAIRKDQMAIDPSQYNITHSFVGPEQLLLTFAEFKQTDPALSVTLTLFSSNNIPYGTRLYPSANLTYFTQPDNAPGALLAPRRKSLLSMPTTVYFNMDPQLYPDANLTYIIYEHTNFTLYARNLFNDTDGEIINDSIFITSPPLHGEATPNLEDASILYVPTPFYTGNDTYQLRICDEFSVCSFATIHIVILPVNDPPLIFPVNATTSALDGVSDCKYPFCEGTWIYPLLDSYSPDDGIELDPKSFVIDTKSLKTKLRGKYTISIVTVLYDDTTTTEPQQPTEPTYSEPEDPQTPLDDDEPIPSPDFDNPEYFEPLDDDTPIDSSSSPSSSKRDLETSESFDFAQSRATTVSVPRRSNSDRLQLTMVRPQNTTIRILYTSTEKRATDFIETIPFRVCDVRGLCNSSEITVKIPGSKIRTVDPRTRSADITGKKCWPSYVFFALSFIFGVRGPATINLMEHMVDYEQFIAYSRYMTGSAIAPPQGYLNFTDCYQWTIFNLPTDYFNFGSKSAAQSNVVTTSKANHDMFMAFYGNILVWILIGLILAMIFAYLVLVPIAIFLWDKLFWDLKQLSRTELQWRLRHRLLYGVGTFFRFAVVAYLPLTFWTLYVEREAPSIHIIAIALSFALPLVLLGIWLFRGNKMFESNVWNAIFYEAFNDFKPKWGWWILVILARSLLIALFVGAIPSKLVSVWLVLVIKLVYLVLICVFRPYTCVFSFTLDILNHAGSALATILFYFVATVKINHNVLIAIHYVVMILLIIVEIVSIVYHFFRWWRAESSGGDKEDKKKHEKELQMAPVPAAGGAPIKSIYPPSSSNSNESSFDPPSSTNEEEDEEEEEYEEEYEDEDEDDSEPPTNTSEEPSQEGSSYSEEAQTSSYEPETDSREDNTDDASDDSRSR